MSHEASPGKEEGAPMICAINDDPVDASPATGRVLTVAVVVVATLVNYVGWLGWDTTKELGPDGYLHGPYEPWQVVGVVAVLGVIAAAVGWRRHPWVAVAVTTTVMTVSFSVQGATDPRNDGLWPIGAFMVAVGTFFGVGLVAFLADAFAGDRSSEQPSTGWHRRPWVWVVITGVLMLSVLYWI